MIRIKCPKCQKVLGLDDSTAGGPALCPACKQKFMVPGAPAKAAAGKPDAKAGADKDAWKKPGTEDDDFTPYTLQDTGPPKKVEDKAIDDMVRFALRQKQRDKAWLQVGLPAKMLKIWTLVVLGLGILVFLYFSLVIILFIHKQKQGIDSSPLFPFNGIPARSFPALLMWVIFFGSFVFTCGVCGVVLAGLEKMKKLESWGFALAGNIVAMVFLGFFGLVFGAWGLSVLLNKDVKAEFYKKPGLAGMEQDEAEEAAEEEEDEDYDDEDEEEDDDDD